MKFFEKIGFRRCKKRKRLSYDIFNIDDLIKRGTKFPHLVGIVISRAAIIGDNCIIYQNVTIGAKSHKQGNRKSENYPVLGNNVTVYAGAIIVGNVKIGDNAVIGANSVVITDVPPNAVYAGNPARFIKYITE